MATEVESISDQHLIRVLCARVFEKKLWCHHPDGLVVLKIVPSGPKFIKRARCRRLAPVAEQVVPKWLSSSVASMQYEKKRDI